jgi:hypothetical protein
MLKHDHVDHKRRGCMHHSSHKLAYLNVSWAHWLVLQVRAMAIKESAELRDRMIANGTRVGRVVASSTGPMGQAAAKFHQHHSYAEVWEDGPRLRELKARQAGILARREELEKRKRQVAKDIRKADKELQQRTSTSTSSSSAAVEADVCGSSGGATAAAAAGTTADDTSSATTGGAASSNAIADAAAAASTAAGVSSDVFSSAAGSSGTAAAYSTAIAAAGTASAAAAAAAMSCPSSSNTLQQQQLQLQQHDDDFELLNADETVKLHMAHLKREEALLAEERKRLEAEKAEQIRIWRRVTLEDRSRFCRQPLLGQRYLITTLLGKGGFSEVWRAFDLAEVREVAIKVSCYCCCST